MLFILNPWISLAAILFALSSCRSAPQKPIIATGEPIIVAFYNVENLFDIYDDPLTADDEFTPNSDKKWTQERYETKLDNLAKVIDAIPGELPHLLGLCEVENEAVLKDLIAVQDMRSAGYGIVHRDSPDGRGIDVALLYQPERFRPIHEQFFTTALPVGTRPNTRHVLYSQGLVETGDTLHVFVNHWPSRSGGERETQPNRAAIAQLVRHKVDSLLDLNANAQILIMGDMNDEPTDRSVAKVLGAATSLLDTQKPLYNLMADAHAAGEGTYNYKGDWNMLDNLIVSWSILDKDIGLYCDPESTQILMLDWMFYTHPKDKLKYPNRTYGGSNYYGGYSDHLPVYTTLQY